MIAYGLGLTGNPGIVPQQSRKGNIVRVMDPLLLWNGLALAEQQLDQALLNIKIQIGLVPLTIQIDIAFVVAGDKHQVMGGIPQGKGKIIGAGEVRPIAGRTVKLRKGGFHLRKAAISCIDYIPGFVKIPVNHRFQLLGICNQRRYLRHSRCSRRMGTAGEQRHTQGNGKKRCFHDGSSFSIRSLI